MNEGTLAILIQWCLLCLVWMGSFDQKLRELGISRKRILAAITVFLVCSFVSWQLYFAPIQVSLSGTLLPLVVGGWLYARMPAERKRLHLLTGVAIALLLFWLRWVFFTDPVLLFWDERVIVPAAGIVASVAMSRRGLSQLFSLMFSLPMADALYTLYFWKLSGTCMLGSEYAQDLIWSGVSLWCLVRLISSAAQRMFGWKNTEPSNSDAGR